MLGYREMTTIVYSRKVLSKKFLTHATQRGMSRGGQTIYEQLLTKYYKNEQTHFEKSRNVISSKSQNTTPTIT